MRLTLSFSWPNGKAAGRTHLVQVSLVSRSLAFQAGCCVLRGESTIGAEGGTRTPTGCPTRPSNVRVCQFRHFGEVRGRSITLSRATDNSPDALAQPRIERVAYPFTEKIVREHRDQNREARIGREPPADLDRVLALVQDVAPGRVRRLDPEPQEGETRLGE